MSYTIVKVPELSLGGTPTYKEIYVVTGTRVDVGQASASTLNTQASLANIQRNRLSDGSPIPLIYGQAQVGGMPFAIDYTSGTWTVGYILCLGEVEGIDSILINGAAPVTGVDVNYYTGTTTQGVNALLAAAIDGYADTLIISDPAGDVGVAYIVIQYTDSQYDSWPTVLATVRGKRVYNPATGETEYSDNPALHLADLISSTTYGLGMTVDDTSLIAVQDYCNDTSLGEIRRESYSVLTGSQDTESWVEILRTYAGCFVVYRGDTCYLVPDKTGTSVMTITADDIEKDSLRITKKDSSDVPTVVRAYYTDTTEDEWKEKLCDPAKTLGVDTGVKQWRESRIRLTGINRHSQAYRECVERLNKLALSDLSLSWVQFDEALDLEIGDIVTVSHPYGLDSKLLRISDEPRQASPGRWVVTAVEYDPAAYSNDVATTPTYSDGNLPSGGAPGAPTGLTISESTYQLLNGEYASRLDITWTAPSNSLVTGYDVVVKAGSTTVWTGDTSTPNISTSTLQESVLLTVYVTSRNSLYAGGTAVASYTIVGKTAIPDAPARLSGFEAGGEVRLSWPASTDVDAKRYEVRYGDTTGSWATATTIDVTDSLRLITSDVPPSSTATGGVWRFYVKTIDSIFQYSTTAATVDLVVTLDDDAFRAGNINPVTTYDSLTYIHASNEVPGETEYYSDGNDTWASLFSSTMSTYTNSLASYQSAQGTSYWYSEVLDLGQDYSGTFRGTIDYTDHSGTATVELGLATDGSPISYSWSSQLSQQGTARYIQLRVSSAGIFQVGVPNGYITADIIAREEVGTFTTSGSPVMATITLTNDYIAARSITLVAEGTSAITCVYDNITLGNPTTFDIYTFNSAGAAVAASGRYTWKGI